jgi:hypothetical protein
VPASALKLWFRELAEPVVPADMYDACVNACDNPTESITVVARLPPLHYEVTLFIVRFLQV